MFGEVMRIPIIEKPVIINVSTLQISFTKEDHHV